MVSCYKAKLSVFFLSKYKFLHMYVLLDTSSKEAKNADKETLF